MFIQTETTADPSRLKFLPGREVLAQGSVRLRSRAEAAASPLAEQLFTIPGVAEVAFDRDSITVAKTSGEWAHLKPPILAAIMDHFVSEAALLRASAGADGASPPEADGPLGRIREALRQVIDPELGYNIVDLGLVYGVTLEADGRVGVTMTTTTPGCPATGYLRQGAGESVSALPDVESVQVELTYDPRWTPAMMSPAAKAHFGIGEEEGW